MKLKEELAADRERAIEERGSERNNIAKKIIEETLMPAFQKAHEADRTYINSEICVITYLEKYVIIPAPFSFDMVETHKYPRTEKYLLDQENVQRIWDSVCNKKERYNFEKVSVANFGKSGKLYVF